MEKGKKQQRKKENRGETEGSLKLKTAKNQIFEKK